MLDLFKKEEINSLKRKISILEEENKKLTIQLEKKDAKAKKIISTKQDTDRELNEARNKISSLINEIQTLKNETTSEVKIAFSESISRNRLDDILFMIDRMQSRMSTLITVYIENQAAFKSVIGEAVDLFHSSSVSLIEKIDSSTGKIIFYDTNRVLGLMIIPVFPVKFSEYALGKRFNTEPFRESLEYGKILVLDAHAGETLLGIVEAGVFLEHEMVRSSVMGKHKQGGWSQKRFQTLIEEDVRHHADKVRTMLDSMFTRHNDIHFVVAGGDGNLIRMIMEGHEYPLIMKSIDALSKGNVDQVLRDILTVRLYWI